jgi:hypothetical protein
MSALKICLIHFLFGAVHSDKATTTIYGMATSLRGEPIVQTTNGVYHIDSLQSWDRETNGRQVKVTGDLWVDYSKVKQGGTEIRKATKKTIMNAKWELMPESRTENLKVVSVTGEAGNCKYSACLITADKDVYYVEELDNWNSKFYGKQVTVTGKLLTRYNPPIEPDEPLRAQITGYFKVFLQAKWKLAK